MVVTLCTTMINIQEVCMVLTMHFMWFLWILQQTATFAIYCINRFGFVTEVERFNTQLLWTHTHTRWQTVGLNSSEKKNIFLICKAD